MNKTRKQDYFLATTTSRSGLECQFDQRMPGLDFLRFVAIVMVFGRHLPPPPGDWHVIQKSILNLWRHGGWVGVDIFFVLSGFLVSGLLFREMKLHGRLSVGRFYLRRGWKIYPPFYVLIFATLINSFLRDPSVPAMQFMSEALFLQSYIQGYYPHTWSLSVEEHFYLGLPILLLATNRMVIGDSPFLGVMIVALATSIGCLSMRIVCRYGCETPPLESYLYQTHLRLDALMFGVLISAFYHYHTGLFIRLLKPVRHAMLLGGAGLLTIPFVWRIEASPLQQTLGLTLFYIAGGMLLTGMLFMEIHRSPLLMTMAWIGSFSYSIYLWHIPVFGFGATVFDRLTGGIFGTQVILFFRLIGAIVFGVVMAKVIEVPALMLRDQWFPSRTIRSKDAAPHEEASATTSPN